MLQTGDIDARNQCDRNPVWKHEVMCNLLFDDAAKGCANDNDTICHHVCVDQ